MAITGSITFLGNGRPVRPSVPQGVNREASARAVRISNAKTVREFQSQIIQEFQPDVKSLGRNAVSIPRGGGGGIDVTI